MMWLFINKGTVYCTAHRGVRYKIFTNDVYHTQPSVMYSRT